MKKTMLLLLSLMMLCGCSSTTTQPISKPVELSEQNNTNKSIETADLIGEEIDGNLLFSPLSLNLALGLLVEGANGTTKEALENYLNTTDFKDFSKYYMYYIQNLNVEKQKNKNIFEIANGLWTRKDITLLEEYQSTIQEYYQGKIDSLDFSQAEKCAKIINNWCKKKTHQMIPTIVSEDMFTSDLAAILVNTVYFESSWSTSWDLATRKEAFTNLDGSKSNIQYITSYEATNYYENEYASAFSYPYQNGLEFIGILPKKQGEFTLSELDIQGLLESSCEFNQLYTKMPVLNYESTIPLKEVLSKSGLELIFDQADFSRMSDHDLAVSDIFQKTKIELDENGTKAAAATVIMMKETSILVDKPIPKEVLLERPYAYLIYDRENNQIVFIGKVNQL